MRLIILYTLFLLTSCARPVHKTAVLYKPVNLIEKASTFKKLKHIPLIDDDACFAMSNPKRDVVCLDRQAWNNNIENYIIFYEILEKQNNSELYYNR